ncbi:MAG TPA: tRNA uracil 4-sulfurtransferase ThiI [Gammaproteobacteria bacterium]|nr:tRNA uracil 4-sulfurtransferase ThiI [Gammaproteobacteria bacterium]
MRPNRLLVHYAEIALKGRNRNTFETQLQGNIRHRLRVAGLPWAVRRSRDRITVRFSDAPPEEVDRAVELLCRTPGVAAVAPARFFGQRRLRGDGGTPDIERLEREMVTLAAERWRPESTFAVRVKRGDKGFPLTSEHLARRLGRTIIEDTDWQRVDLSRPDQTFHLDIYPDGLYLYGERKRGVGGLPVYSGGHVLSLISSGLDSPVAAWMMARRGARTDFLHMTATLVSPAHAGENLVSRIVARLSEYTLHSRLFLLPYTHFDLALMGKPRSGFEMILFRRFLARAGERIAQRLDARAMVTGDSFGQVASQTLENMVTCSRAATMPLLRPLVGLDKQEIVDRARVIGTFDLSSKPYKDCCALIGRNPRTRSLPEHIDDLESRTLPDYEALLDRTLADGVTVDFDCGRVVAIDRLDAGAG